MSERPIDVPRLFRVWCNRKFTFDEVACILQISRARLRKLAALHRLPKRYFARRQETADDEPSEAQKAEYAARAAECREIHYAMRRGEQECCTSSKVSKWRREICLPR